MDIGLIYCLNRYRQEKDKHFQNICISLNQFAQRKSEMRLRGFNDFNYFELLSGRANETSHSKVIAEFLDPSGSHYQGNLFLHRFFDLLGISEFKIQSWQVHTEYFIEDEVAKGQGRIDIALVSEDSFIILENKVYAGEQEAQIYKYVEAIKVKHQQKKIYVLYLTLNGDDPSSYSLEHYKINDGFLYDRNQKMAEYNAISYSLILEWMHYNLEEVANISNLREAVSQYIKTLKKLLGKDKNIMNLQDYLLEDNNRDALMTLIENQEDFFLFLNKPENEKCKEMVEQENVKSVIEDIKFYLRKSVVDRLKNYIIKNYSQYIDGHFGDRGKMSHIIFTNNDLKYSYILFLNYRDYKELILGRLNCDGIDPKDIEQISDKCKQDTCYDVIGTKYDCFEKRKIDSMEYYQPIIGNLDNYVEDKINEIKSEISKFESN